MGILCPHVARELGREAALGEVEMNALGANGWDLAGLFRDATSAHVHVRRPIRA
jgi:hypothetical protein